MEYHSTFQDRIGNPIKYLFGSEVNPPFLSFSCSNFRTLLNTQKGGAENHTSPVVHPSHDNSIALSFLGR